MYIMSMEAAAGLLYSFGDARTVPVQHCAAVVAWKRRANSEKVAVHILIFKAQTLLNYLHAARGLECVALTDATLGGSLVLPSHGRA